MRATVDCTIRARRAASRHHVGYMVAWMASALMLLVLAGCAPRGDDEAQLRETMQQMRSAVDERDARGFMRHVAEDFSAGDHGMDRDGLGRFLRMQMLANQQIRHLVGPLDIDVDGDRATISFPLTLTGGAQRIIPERGGQYRMVTGWRRDGRQWQCYHAHWERVL